MELKGKIIKLKDNKIRGRLDAAQYTLTYRPDADRRDSAATSHAILSALKGDGDVLLEINTNLLYDPGVPHEDLIRRCIDTAKKLELEYRYSKIPPSNRSSLFDRLFAKKPGDAHDLLVRIPAEIWNDKALLDLILPYGARYYLGWTSSGSETLPDACLNMMDSEKLERFRIIVFDTGRLGHMGINSATLEPSEIGKLLGLG